MSASEQLDKLADRAKQTEENIEHAKEEGQAELKARVQRARESSEKHAAEFKSGAKAKASKWWTDVQDDWNKHIDKIRKDVDDRKEEHDVKRAEHRAEPGRTMPRPPSPSLMPPSRKPSTRCSTPSWPEKRPTS